MFPRPMDPPLFDIGRLGELLIMGGAGGTVGGLMGGDLLSPVSRRLFAIFASSSPSSDRSRFKLELTNNEGSKGAAFGETLVCCLRAISLANMDGRSA